VGFITFLVLLIGLLIFAPAIVPVKNAAGPAAWPRPLTQAQLHHATLLPTHAAVNEYLYRLRSNQGLRALADTYQHAHPGAEVTAPN
jgi:hypothetical protein